MNQRRAEIDSLLTFWRIMYFSLLFLSFWPRHVSKILTEGSLLDTVPISCEGQHSTRTGWSYLLLWHFASGRYSSPIVTVSTLLILVPTTEVLVLYLDGVKTAADYWNKNLDRRGWREKAAFSTREAMPVSSGLSSFHGVLSLSVEVEDDVGTWSIIYITPSLTDTHIITTKSIGFFRLDFSTLLVRNILRLNQTKSFANFQQVN